MYCTKGKKSSALPFSVVSTIHTKGTGMTVLCHFRDQIPLVVVCLHGVYNLHCSCQSNSHPNTVACSPDQIWE